MKRLAAFLVAGLIFSANASDVVEEGCMHGFVSGICVLRLPAEATKPEVCNVKFTVEMSNGEVKTAASSVKVIPGKFSTSTIEVERTGEIIKSMDFSKTCK